MACMEINFIKLKTIRDILHGKRKRTKEHNMKQLIKRKRIQKTRKHVWNMERNQKHKENKTYNRIKELYDAKKCSNMQKCNESNNKSVRKL